MAKALMHQIERIRVELGDRSYPVDIGNSILPDLGIRMKELDISKKVSIISNPTVSNLYGYIVENSLRKSGFQTEISTIPDGEEYKSLLWVSHLYDELLSYRLDRKSPVIALGGGVIGDMAGFVAATYMRGIPYVQVPTTLLAQVDSSVGGKTGVNHILGKNLIGAFYQPSLVWIDAKTLETLPLRELKAGMAEVIKYGVIADPQFFIYLESNIEKAFSLDEIVLAHIIKRSCEIKADVVSRDEKESGIRAILNFGHTIGHAIEALTNYNLYKHGEAVATGMIYEAWIAYRMGVCDKDIFNRIKTLIKKSGFSFTLPEISQEKLIETMQIDKKAKEGRIMIVLPEKIGKVSLRPVDSNFISTVLKEKKEVFE